MWLIGSFQPKEKKRSGRVCLCPSFLCSTRYLWNLTYSCCYCIPGLAQERGTISEDIVRNAFSATEEGFLSLVRRTHLIKPSIASIGSCCLVGIIWKGTLYLANLGDSRAVVGCLTGSNKIVAEQLTRDHNASMEEVRQELRSLHPDDSQIVVLKNGVWRIKGIIQVGKTFMECFCSWLLICCGKSKNCSGRQIK